MSFSSDIKTDLTRVRVKSPEARRNQLIGLTRTCGALVLGSGGAKLLYRTESLSVGRHILALSRSLCECDGTIELLNRAHRKTPLTAVKLSGASVRPLIESICGAELLSGVPEEYMERDEDRRALLRGAFLGGGSVSAPERGYHLEIIARTDAFAHALCMVSDKCDLPAHTVVRRDQPVVYWKGDDVSGMLALLGTASGALAFENVRTEKDFRNYVNRTSNCETANIGKTVDASVAQVAAIECIEDRVGLRTLPPPLYEAALLRMNHREATLAELADMAEIGKSGMNHRLSRLLLIAEELKT